jgi:hypothetical protein
VSTSGKIKNKFQILNFQCLRSSLLLKRFTWNSNILLMLEMSRVSLYTFEKVTSSYEIWNWEIQKLVFHFLRNGER